MRNLSRDIWMKQAACAGIPSGVFFADEQTVNARTYDQARTICAVCPVQTECLQFAMENGETEGFWGGKSPKERFEMAKKERKCGPTPDLLAIPGDLGVSRGNHKDRSSRADRKRRADNGH